MFLGFIWKGAVQFRHSLKLRWKIVQQECKLLGCQALPRRSAAVTTGETISVPAPRQPPPSSPGFQVFAVRSPQAAHKCMSFHTFPLPPLPCACSGRGLDRDIHCRTRLLGWGPTRMAPHSIWCVCDPSTKQECRIEG